MSSGQKLCGTYSPKVKSTQTLSALASNKHYHVEREGERERLAGGRPARSTKWLHFLKLNHTLSLLICFCGGKWLLKAGGGFLDSVHLSFFLKALVRRQSELRVEEGT